MPIYEYSCRTCGHEWEELQSFKDEPVRVCPECQQEQAEKRQIPSSTNFTLNGSCWAKDGYSS